VDNGIVVVENIYRLMSKEGVPRVQAAKLGIGEVALPIIVSTATTIAAFIPSRNMARNLRRIYDIFSNYIICNFRFLTYSSNIF
jgi:multidrug efflux pump subunit AcrB